jgi:hypothetical protein
MFFETGINLITPSVSISPYTLIVGVTGDVVEPDIMILPDNVVFPSNVLLPICVVEPDTFNEPVNDVFPIRVLDPVVINEPEIYTDWRNVLTYDAVSEKLADTEYTAYDAVTAYDELSACVAYDAVTAFCAQLAVPCNDPVIPGANSDDNSPAEPEVITLRQLGIW